MKKLLATLGLVALAMLLCAPAVYAEDGPNVTITLLNPPTGGELRLAVGESYTFQVQITSDQPFVFAAAMPDAYYPGRGVFFRGRDQVTKDTSALLHLTVTGKRSTADLEPVCGWYTEPDDCLEGGIAPLAVVAGARFKGGLTVGQVFPFSVVVE